MLVEGRQQPVCLKHRPVAARYGASGEVCAMAPEYAAAQRALLPVRGVYDTQDEPLVIVLDAPTGTLEEHLAAGGRRTKMQREELVRQPHHVRAGCGGSDDQLGHRIERTAAASRCDAGIVAATQAVDCTASHCAVQASAQHAAGGAVPTLSPLHNQGLKSWLALHL